MKLLLFIPVFLTSCTSTSNTAVPKEATSSNIEAPQAAPPSDSEINSATEWLQKTIAAYFAQDDQLAYMKKITTSSYFDYKLDAMNVDMGTDESLTELAFHQKWKGKYDTQNAGIQNGFLIDGQDWIDVNVTSVVFLEKQDDGLLFDVRMEDKKMNGVYPRKIKVMPHESGFLIADVIESISPKPIN